MESPKIKKKITYHALSLPHFFVYRAEPGKLLVILVKGKVQFQW